MYYISVCSDTVHIQRYSHDTEHIRKWKKWKSWLKLFHRYSLLFCFVLFCIFVVIALKTVSQKWCKNVCIHSLIRSHNIRKYQRNGISLYSMCKELHAYSRLFSISPLFDSFECFIYLQWQNGLVLSVFYRILKPFLRHEANKRRLPSLCW